MTMRVMRLSAIVSACLATTIASVSPAAAQDLTGAASCCEDPNTTRLILGPTARPLPKGAVSLGIHGLILSVQIGITDRVSVGGGTPFLFPLTEHRPFLVTPKVALLNRGGTQVAVGAVHTFKLNGVGVAYGVMTTGTSRRSVTAGAGVAYASDGQRSLVVMAGGDRKVRRKMKFMTENYYFGGQVVLSAGCRFFDERKSLDAAVAAPINRFAGVVPTLSFVYRF